MLNTTTNADKVCELMCKNDIISCASRCSSKILMGTQSKAMRFSVLVRTLCTIRDAQVLCISNETHIHTGW